MTKSEVDNKLRPSESFLLRLWSAEDETGQRQQQVMLRSVMTGESLYFPNLAALVTFLQNHRLELPVCQFRQGDGRVMDD
ncbi:MAG: hypothetical protein R3C62_10900 [Chloroflexota bacterium]